MKRWHEYEADRELKNQASSNNNVNVSNSNSNNYLSTQQLRNVDSEHTRNSVNILSSYGNDEDDEMNQVVLRENVILRRK